MFLFLQGHRPEPRPEVSPPRAHYPAGQQAALPSVNPGSRSAQAGGSVCPPAAFHQRASPRLLLRHLHKPTAFDLLSIWCSKYPLFKNGFMRPPAGRQRAIQGCELVCEFSLHVPVHAHSLPVAEIRFFQEAISDQVGSRSGGFSPPNRHC